MSASPTIRRDRVALNPLQWINVKADPADPGSDDLWRYADPDFHAEYPGFLRAVRADRLDRQIQLLGEAADVLAAEGIRAGLHNHVGTWIEAEAEIERVFATLPRDLLGASDIGHLVWVDVDPIAMLQRRADRLIDLHIKDLDLDVAAASRATPTSYRAATDDGIFLEPGLGGVDLDAVLAALPADFGGWIVVDRGSMDPLASAEACWRWVEARLR